jgi:hypothetical protein
MRQIKLEGLVIAKSPIHHGGDEKTGASPTLRRTRFFSHSENAFVDIPFISGNAVRGNLRRLLVRDMLQRLEIELKSPQLVHLLFSGGILTSTDETTGTLDLEFRNALQATLPPLALFGGSIGNVMITSPLKVAHLLPICKELTYLLPPRFANLPQTQYPVRTFTDFIFQTRKDEIRDRAEDDPTVQMYVDIEGFITGTAFYHEFWLVNPTPIVEHAFYHALALWQQFPFVGGKSATGYGEIEFEYYHIDSTRWQPPEPNLYLQHLEQNANEIKQILQTLAARLGDKQAWQPISPSVSP